MTKNIPIFLITFVYIITTWQFFMIDGNDTNLQSVQRKSFKCYYNL